MCVVLSGDIVWCLPARHVKVKALKNEGDLTHRIQSPNCLVNNLGKLWLIRVLHLSSHLVKESWVRDILGSSIQGISHTDERNSA